MSLKLSSNTKPSLKNVLKGDLEELAKELQEVSLRIASIQAKIDDITEQIEKIEQ